MHILENMKLNIFPYVDLWLYFYLWKRSVDSSLISWYQFHITYILIIWILSQTFSVLFSFCYFSLCRSFTFLHSKICSSFPLWFLLLLQCLKSYYSSKDLINSEFNFLPVFLWFGFHIFNSFIYQRCIFEYCVKIWI